MKIIPPKGSDFKTIDVYYLNDIKRRSSKIYDIPVELLNMRGHDDFWMDENPIRTTITFDEFITSSTKNEYAVFKIQK